MQKRFTKRLVGLKALPHAQRLRSLSLTTLEFRRLHVDLTWCYKIVFDLVDVARDDFFCYVDLCQLALEVMRLNCTSQAQTRPEVVSLQVAS